MAAEKNCQYLLLLVDSRICGIDLTKLIKPKEEDEAVDWEKQPPPPFDLSIDLPLDYMHVLELDSKIVLIGGYHFFFKSDRPRSLAGATPSNKFYELDLDKEEVAESKSIQDSELTFNSMHHHLQKMGTDYYFIMMDDVKPMGCPANFSVLRSGTKDWEYLPDVPPDPFLYVDDIDTECSSRVYSSSFFDFYGILYIRMCLEDGEVFIFTYNTRNPLKDWTMSKDDNDFTRSFCVTVAAQPLFLTPAVCIPDFVDTGKYLALSCERIGGEDVIYAFLVDQLGVCIFQRLEDCFDKLPSSFIHEEKPRLVDFDGKGTVGVMLPGFIKVKENPALCVLVLQVFAKRVLDNPTQILGRSESSPTQFKFLDSKVLAMNMYSMKGIEIWCPVFVFPNSQCQDPGLGKRKWSKLI
ncbi:hypothetical protein PIB30_025848 [Stylosanthes scabra]|uniref:DUF1618 domain-containing protein n=1 Tax=Stylosanthes scabra TaxID=79078 RepID=A0ABU6W849_9FABA|nr:hypothetical protein [Stylosanthes scabra]